MSKQPLVKNAANASQVNDADYKKRSAREKELDDVRVILNLKEGRRFVWRYLSECGVFQTSFTGQSNQTFFNEGSRNVGLKLLADVNEANPESYVTMVNEGQGELNV